MAQIAFEGRLTADADRRAGRLAGLLSRSRREGDCLIWQGSKDGCGYGMVRHNGPSARVHRVVWELTNGAIPPGMLVDHTCWNRACINADHLRLATRQQNNYNLRSAKPGRTLPRNIILDGGKYLVRVTKAGKCHKVGRFVSLDDAVAAAATKRRELFGEFAGHSRHSIINTEENHA